MLDSMGARRYGDAALLLRALHIFRLNVGLIAGPFDFAFPERGRGIGRKRANNFVERTFLATGAGIEDENFHGAVEGQLVGPFPVANFRQVVAMLADVLFVLDELVAEELFE